MKYSRRQDFFLPSFFVLHSSKKIHITTTAIFENVIFALQRVVSSVGLEHYLDRVRVTGSTPVQPTLIIRKAVEKQSFFYCCKFAQPKRFCAIFIP